VSKQTSDSEFRRALRKLPFFDETKVIEALSSSGWAWALLWTAVLTLVAGYLAIQAGDRDRYAVNQLQLDPIYSRVDFVATDQPATELARKNAAELELPAYRANEAFFNRIRSQIDSLAVICASNINSFSQLPKEGRLINDDRTLFGLRTYIINGQPVPAYKALVSAFMTDLATNMAILTPEQADIEKDVRQRSTGIHLLPGFEDPVDLQDNLILSTRRTDETRTLVTLIADKHFDKSFYKCFVEIVMKEAETPSYIYDPDLTKQRKAARAAQVPVESKSFKQGDLLVRPGTVIDRADIEKLTLEDASWNIYIAQHHPRAALYQNIGRIGVVGLLALFLWLYILAVNPRVGQNPLRGMALTGLLVSTLAFTTLSAVASPPRLLYLTAIFPTLLCAVILAIAYTRRFAFAVAALNALLVTFVMDMGLGYAVVALTGVGVSVGLLKSVNTRSKLVLAGIASGLAMAVAVILTGLAARPVLFDEQWAYLRTDALRVLGTGVATGLLIQGLLPAIEFLFKVTTQLTLKELNDASLPLLRRLAQDAPGTYQHSLRMADMAQAAATAIGADGLLARVGAMYHDIGKLSKPEYFVENQASGPNPHDSLSPPMSASIILAHVSDGMDMARQYAIPVVVRHFIESHHGTTLVEYFYHHAKKQAQLQGLPDPVERSYRYDGPIPQTREAAILMICDGVEGAARTLQDPTPARFEELVTGMIQKRLADGQFDQCGITLQDLNKVHAAIVNTLCAMYHKRIVYPTSPDTAIIPHTPPLRITPASHDDKNQSERPA
jgi:cyclic-di-AMP phosphodiesterase PgpH